MEGKVAIIQYYFEGGGGSLVLANIVKTLNNLGIVPDIHCFKGVAPSTLRRMLGIQVEYNLVVNGRNFKKSSLLNSLIFSFFIRKEIEGYDYVINLQGVNFFLNQCTDLYYVHHPKAEEVLEGFSRSNILQKLKKIIYHYIFKHQRYNNKKLILVNSNFTKEKIEKYYKPAKGKIRVIYPPVSFTNLSLKRKFSKKNIIASVGRISKDKRQIDQVALAKEMKDFEFYIIGRVSDENYFRLLTEFIKENRLNNVKILTETENDELKQILLNTKFYLHTKINEHFGISIVEAIAAGCIPLMHRSGGQVEILNDDKFCYESIHEIPEMVKNFNTKNLEEIRNINFKKIKRFSDLNFRNYISQILSF